MVVHRALETKQIPIHSKNGVVVRVYCLLLYSALPWIKQKIKISTKMILSNVMSGSSLSI